MCSVPVSSIMHTCTKCYITQIRIDTDMQIIILYFGLTCVLTVVIFTKTALRYLQTKQ